MTAVVCAREQALPVEEFRRVLVASGLGATRPVDDAPRLRQMLAAAGLVMTARTPAGRLVGVARCLSDGAWVAYLAELAVDGGVQGQGVGRTLLQAVRDELGPDVSLVLASVPDAVAFYEKVGMPRMPDVFFYRRTR
ncbi:GNAT family N-acetyltransferase [Rubrivivax sp. RP6-9]|uniref:GNAT family N-acetyltransferase n=1 Tax=Rubrivivax sp. RP6-9 TaxID=3415750 RepID=UPI003CC5666D